MEDKLEFHIHFMTKNSCYRCDKCDICDETSHMNKYLEKIETA